MNQFQTFIEYFIKGTVDDVETAFANYIKDVFCIKPSQHTLNEQLKIELMNMFKSQDKNDHVLALEILRNSDVFKDVSFIANEQTIYNYVLTGF